MTITKYFAGGIVLLGILMVSFLFALRGCLSAYDERYALPPVVYFEKDGKQVLLSLVKYSKTTSYVQEMGITTKTFSNSYYLQLNDAASGEKILNKKIEGHSIIQHFPEEIIGASNQQAWIFIDGLMAVDAFSLATTADKKLIEDKNPLLKGKLPDERQYYHFNYANSTISITATDGLVWILNTHTLKAIAEEEIKKDLSTEETIIQAKLNNGQRLNPGYRDMTVNQDTSNGQWFGLYAANEIEKLSRSVTISPAYTQDERRQLMTAPYKEPTTKNFTIDKIAVQNNASGNYFLDAGFLADKTTGNTIHLINPESYLVIYKSKIGSEGRILLCRLGKNGQLVWKTDTDLEAWTDYQLQGQRLFVTGSNNKALGAGKCNSIQSIDLRSGKTNRYDYSLDKLVQ